MEVGKCIVELLILISGLKWPAVRILVALILGIVFFATSSGGGDGAVTWLLGIFKFYALWFPGFFLLDFNPCETYVKSFPVRFLNGLIRLLTCGALPRYFGGTWYAERDSTLAIIRESLNPANPSSYEAFHVKKSTQPAHRGSKIGGVKVHPEPASK